MWRDIKDFVEITWLPMVAGAILLIGIVSLIAVAQAPKNVTNPPEEQGNWLRVERTASIGAGHRVMIACDLVTGDKLAIVTSGYGDAVSIIPGGCKP